MADVTGSKSDLRGGAQADIDTKKKGAAGVNQIEKKRASLDARHRYISLLHLSTLRLDIFI
jgi:hypothetical protein